MHRLHQWSPESRHVPDPLSGSSAGRTEALAELRALLLRGARFELGRARQPLGPVSGEELDDLAVRAADDALVAVVEHLDSFRGSSRFTTWASKFALREARLKLGAARREAALASAPRQRGAA